MFSKHLGIALTANLFFFHFSGEILITNCEEEQSYASQLIQYISDTFSCPSAFEEFAEEVMEFVRENAPPGRDKYFLLF